MSIYGRSSSQLAVSKCIFLVQTPYRLIGELFGTDFSPSETAGILSSAAPRATEPNVLVDGVYHGKPSELLLHADRNGFFSVLDRTDGKLLLAKPFLRRVDCAKSISAQGRPVVADPRGCPSDAANWDSTAFSPVRRLYYFMALEECVGAPTGYPDQTGQRFLRAVNIETGEISWEVPQPGPARAKTWSGVLATAGGLVFYGPMAALRP